MSLLKIISWNVLYRKHEKKFNPESKILSKYPNEDTRVKDTVNTIKSIIDHLTVVCLQECSWDTLMSLYNSLTCHFIFYHHVNDKEYIVTCVPKHNGFYKQVVTQSSCSNGVLVVTNGHLTIANCHLVPQAFSNKNVVNEVVRNFPVTNMTVFAGDFNECYTSIKRKLQDVYTVPPHKKTYKNKSIDHIFVDAHSSKFLELQTGIIKTYYLSDHNIIWCHMHKVPPDRGAHIHTDNHKSDDNDLQTC